MRCCPGFELGQSEHDQQSAEWDERTDGCMDGYMGLDAQLRKLLIEKEALIYNVRIILTTSPPPLSFTQISCLFLLSAEVGGPPPLPVRTSYVYTPEKNRGESRRARGGYGMRAAVAAAASRVTDACPYFRAEVDHFVSNGHASLRVLILP